MSWLLDTDVICRPAKRHGDARVIAWIEREQERCYMSAVVIAQLAWWVRTKEGRQRQALQAWLTRLVDALHGRVHLLPTFGLNRSEYLARLVSPCPLKTATLRLPPAGMG